jgi:hypothetical protein
LEVITIASALKFLVIALMLTAVSAYGEGYTLDEPCNGGFRCTYGGLIVLSPFVLVAIFAWLFFGNFCCPTKIIDYTENWPDPLKFCLRGIIGIPFFLIMNIGAGIYLMIVAALIPLQLLGIGRARGSLGREEPRISNQVDLDE